MHKASPYMPLKTMKIFRYRGFAILVILLIFNSQFSILNSQDWNDAIKSIYLSPVNDELALPIIHLDEPGVPSQQLLLRFDILSPIPHNLRYRILHCSRDWQPDSLDPSEFFSGPTEGAIDNYQSSFTTLIDYTNYYQQLPYPYGYFLASGNYLVQVFPEGHPDSVIFSRPFYVVEDAANIDVAIDRSRSISGTFNTHQELSITVSPSTGPPTSPWASTPLLQQSDYYTVIARQNRRLDLTRILPFSNYSNSSLLYQWSPDNSFPGGNHFRYFDLSNLRATMYHVQRVEQLGGHIFAFLQPDEVKSRNVYTQYNSLNGGMRTNIRDRQNPQIEADYVWVNFSLPIERPFLDGSIHIVGDLTDWQLNDSSRMDWNPRYKAYTKRLLLKQGYYSYQLIFLPAGETQGQTSRIEGDHFEMTNSYTIFVYYRPPGARFDRLVGLVETTP